MYGNAKILFFCMIFVGKAAFGQEKGPVKVTGLKHFTINNQTDTFNFSLKRPIKVTDKYFTGFLKNNPPVSPKPNFFSRQPVIAGNFYTQNFGFFCKKELQLEKLTKVPLKFRLGSVQQCDWLEGKPNSPLR